MGLTNEDLAVHRPLLLRGNRFLGAALQERELISVDALEAANQQFLEVLQSGDLRRASLLNILLYETNALEEETFLTHLIERENLGLIDVRLYDLPKTFDRKLDLGMCWVTQTLPIDREDDFHFLVSTYALSKPVVNHWEEQLSGHLIWYTVSPSVLQEAFDELESLLAQEAEAEV